jgi:hypothetical protein
LNEEEAIRLAKNAIQLLEDPTLDQAFKSIEEHYTNTWRRSKPSEYELREECHAQLWSLFQLRRQLQSFFETGKILSASSADGERLKN